MTAIFQKPFVLSIGPQRAGAHYIYDYFKARGDVCLPAGVKEIFFFDRHYQRGVGFYDNHFAVRAHHNLLAEVSTTVFDHPDAPRRVFEVFGKDVLLMCPLRHPVERSLALYRDCLRYGIVKGSIEEACVQAPQILFSSRYADHLERWFEIFGPEAVQILYYEEAEADLGFYLSEMCRHIGLPYTQPVRQKKSLFPFSALRSGFWKNRAGSEETQNARRWLEKQLGGEVLKLENLLDRTLPLWRHGKAD